MCHSRLLTPETTFSLFASIPGNGAQVDLKGEILCFQYVISEGFLAFSRGSRGYYGEVGLLEMTSC